MRTMQVVLAAFALAVAGTAAVPVASAAKPRAATPDLSGAWTLDRARSDDPAAKMREAMEAARAGGEGPPDMRGGGGPPGMGGGMGGPPGGGMGGPPGGGRKRPDREPGARGTGEEAAHSGSPGATTPDAFAIAPAGDTLAFLDHGLRVRAVLVGGKPKSARAAGVPIAAGRWKKGCLLVTGTGPRGDKVEESWALADGGATLRCTSTAELPGSGGSVAWTRVYVRAAADAGRERGGTP